MKKFNKKTIVLEGHIVDVISDYIQEYKPGYDKGFDVFSDEVILYALLEYSKFPRPYSVIERIKYIYEKCVSFSNKGLNPTDYTVELEYDYDEESWFIKPKESKLPF
jgi:hypothetical protein